MKSLSIQKIILLLCLVLSFVFGLLFGLKMKQNRLIEKKANFKNPLGAPYVKGPQSPPPVLN